MTSRAVIFAVITTALVLLAHLSLGAAAPAWAQGTAASPLPKECDIPGTPAVGSPLLPNLSATLRGRKKLTILAMGGTSSSLRGPISGGNYAVVERFLEATFKGLDVVIVHRGVSGELAADAGERIKMEVALASADLVLWQVGTADALAQVPVEDFRAALNAGVAWLKSHKIDVILVGLRYTRSMSTDPHYQRVRQAVDDVAKEQTVLRIGRYDAEETLERLRAERGQSQSDVEATEENQACMAERLARVIAAGLFVRSDGRPAGK